jgi:hypothetical protein
MKTKEPSDAVNHCIAELNALVSNLTDDFRGDEIFRKHIELQELYGPQMTSEERVQMFGGFYTRVEPVKA